MIKEINILNITEESDFKDCLFDEKLLIGDLRYKNLKKWIRYIAVDYGDADKVLKTKDNASILFNKFDCGKWEYIDCIFSFKTFFNAFLRMYFNCGVPCYGELMDCFDEYFNVYSIASFQKKYDLSEDVISNFFEVINIFALRTHTIGNYMPCPDEKYNKIKGYGKGYEYFQDRVELLYKEIEDEQYKDYIDKNKREKWKTWFNDNKEKLFLKDILDNIDELSKYKCSKIRKTYEMQNKQDLIDYKEYIKKVNDLIYNRSLKMLLKIKNE